MLKKKTNYFTAFKNKSNWQRCGSTPSFAKCSSKTTFDSRQYLHVCLRFRLFALEAVFVCGVLFVYGVLGIFVFLFVYFISSSQKRIICNIETVIKVIHLVAYRSN